MTDQILEYRAPEDDIIFVSLFSGTNVLKLFIIWLFIHSWLSLCQLGICILVVNERCEDFYITERFLHCQLTLEKVVG